MTDYILEINNISKCYNGLRVLDDLSAKIPAKKIVGLIGPNGAGKTTLFNIINRMTEPNNGIIYFKNTDIIRLPSYMIARLGIIRTFQEMRIVGDLSVIENVLLCSKNIIGEKLLEVFMKARAIKANERCNIDKALSLLNYAGLQENINTLASNLSYGQQKLLSIVCCLAADADMLLLDEPIAGIAPLMVEKILSIIAELPQKGKSILLIEHNIEALMRICDHIIFLDAGKKIFEGTPKEIRGSRAVIDAYLD
jgi:ABC-type branched-subunit amino acid transport system ATPase component